jgi:hypothetical protein
MKLTRRYLDIGENGVDLPGLAPRPVDPDLFLDGETT